MDLKDVRRESCFLSFPRRRGDGPLSAFGGDWPVEFPPQARGWTLERLEAHRAAVVSPAGAGMDPTRGGTATMRGRFPRRRGDGPSPWSMKTQRSTFPPQARGWTPGSLFGLLAVRVSPAGAGMDPVVDPGLDGKGGFPRRRGDGPIHGCMNGGGGMFPPQARGWTVGVAHRVAVGGVSPAGAGMDPTAPPPQPTARSFPRRRGDGPSRFSAASVISAFPPQARGWTRRRRSGFEGRFVSPAGAGMDPEP